MPQGKGYMGQCEKESKEENIAQQFYRTVKGKRVKRGKEKKKMKRRNEKKKTEVDLIASFRVLKNFPRLGRNSISLMHRALQNAAFISSFR